MRVFAKDMEIIAGQDITVELSSLLKEFANSDEQKELVFEPGEYLISSAKCDIEMLNITNTVGDDEFKEGGVPHKAAVALNLKNIRNLKITGNGATFVIDGKVTNMAVQGCDNLEICGIAFKTVNPDFHEIKVVKKTAFSVNFELCGDSLYEKNENGKGFSFIGTDYHSDFYKGRINWGYLHKIFAEDENHVVRVKHPFFTAVSIKEIEKNLFRVRCPNTSRFTVGETYGIYDAIRKYNGIFIGQSKDIVLNDVKQYFNYGLALVCQDTENLTVDGAYFAPEKNSGRYIASCADFMQVCMCKGDIKITNGYFEGAGDDCLNVHGIHFAVIKIDGQKLIVRFMHPQSHGFNPLHKGDLIEYIDPKTLLTNGKAAIKASKLINEVDIELEVDSTDGAVIGDVIEDITMCPSLYFAGNTLNRIITRGLLITTRGNVLVENNHFMNTEMDAILVSNDAKNWYESGRVLNAVIKGNRFDYCGGYYVEILPENGSTGSIVHGDFIVEENDFNSPAGGGINAKSAQRLTIRNNKVNDLKSDFVKAKDIKRLKSDIG
ncbi:MAG: right-handed parallel beta-helix repeat-containing protein [Eubacteriales bacterium]